KISTFGESHGVGIGVVIDGCPAGVNFDVDYIQHELSRRKPGQSRITTQRKEADEFEVLSGVFEGKTTGTPIAILIRSQDQRSKDECHSGDSLRPPHADDTWQERHGTRDYRGGGRGSGSEAGARVAGGALAELVLTELGVSVSADGSQVGPLKVSKLYTQLNR